MGQPNRTMTDQQIEEMLIYMNQADPRIEPNMPNKRIWVRAVGKYPSDVVVEAFDDFVSRVDRKPTPSAIKELCSTIWQKREADLARRALVHDPSKITFTEWKKRNPGEAYRLFEEGRKEQAEQTGRSYMPLKEPPAWTFSDASAIKNLNTHI